NRREAESPHVRASETKFRLVRKSHQVRDLARNQAQNSNPRPDVLLNWFLLAWTRACASFNSLRCAVLRIGRGLAVPRRTPLGLDLGPLLRRYHRFVAIRRQIVHREVSTGLLGPRRRVRRLADLGYIGARACAAA